MEMVNTLDSGPSGPGSNRDRGHFVVFLGSTLYYHSDPFRLCVLLGLSEFNAGGNPSIYLPLMCVRNIYFVCLRLGHFLSF